MTEFRKKIERMVSLIKIRQLQLEHEKSILQNISTKRVEAKDDLQHYQRMYIEGVDRLNQERQSSERKMLEALERSIDLAKLRWHQKLQILRKIEEEEQVQSMVVQSAHRELKKLEKLDERYDSQLKAQLGKIEQKSLDEFAIQNARRKLDN